MLKATLIDAEGLRDLLGVVNTMLEEAEFKITSEGMKLRAMDSSHVAMVDLDLPSAFFDKYECGNTTELRFNVNNVLDLLENMGPKESMELNYSEEQARLVIHLRGAYERVFSVATLAVENEFEREPSVAFKVRAQVETSSLKKVITDSLKIGDHIFIEADTNMIIFRTTGLNGDVVSTLKKDEPPLSELSVSENSKADYSLELLGKIIKNASQVSDVVQVEYSTNNVLRLGLDLPQGKLQFYLSPMVEAS